MKTIYFFPLLIIVSVLGLGLILDKIDLSEFLSSIAVSYIAYKDFILNIADKITSYLIHHKKNNNGKMSM